MADVFISYKSERRNAAQHLKRILELHGYSVWFDYALLTGRDFARQIETELTAAKAVVVLWCSRSVQSEWVINEAHYAKEHAKFIPIWIEQAPLPFGFQRDDTINLIRWDASPRSPDLDRLFDQIAHLVGRDPMPDMKGLRDHEANWKMFGAPSLATFALDKDLESERAWREEEERQRKAEEEIHLIAEQERQRAAEQKRKDAEERDLLAAAEKQRLEVVERAKQAELLAKKREAELQAKRGEELRQMQQADTKRRIKDEEDRRQCAKFNEHNTKFDSDAHLNTKNYVKQLQKETLEKQSKISINIFKRKILYIATSVFVIFTTISIYIKINPYVLYPNSNSMPNYLEKNLALTWEEAVMGSMSAQYYLSTIYKNSLRGSENAFFRVQKYRYWLILAAKNGQLSAKRELELERQ